MRSYANIDNGASPGGAGVPGFSSNIAFTAAVAAVCSFRFNRWLRRYGSLSVLRFLEIM